MINFRIPALTLFLLLVLLLNVNGQIPFDENLSSLRATQTDNAAIKLTWDSNNAPFLIERYLDNTRNFTTIADNVTGGEFIDQNTTLGKIYTYKLTNSEKEFCHWKVF